MPKGWNREPARHSLAAKGVKTALPGKRAIAATLGKDITTKKSENITLDYLDEELDFADEILDEADKIMQSVKKISSTPYVWRIQDIEEGDKFRKLNKDIPGANQWVYDEYPVPVAKVYDKTIGLIKSIVMSTFDHEEGYEELAKNSKNPDTISRAKAGVERCIKLRGKGWDMNPEGSWD